MMDGDAESFSFIQAKQKPHELALLPEEAALFLQQRGKSKLRPFQQFQQFVTPPQQSISFGPLAFAETMDNKCRAIETKAPHCKLTRPRQRLERAIIKPKEMRLN